MKKILFAALVALSLSAPVQAGFDEGLSAAQKGDYATAFREWEPLAKQGDVDAQNYLGFRYSNGQGVKQDDFKAVEWYTKAAK
ncbi:sel1 repeat family protein, partial [Thiomicrorhabdus sp. 6S2-11]|nr:sel1 repeat family protein [Thiomicrorhabdus marina]